MAKYSSQWDDSDIVFLVEKQEFHCHYFVLKMNSPVFRAMFKGDFKESKETPTPLPGKTKEAFKMFLDLMYPLEDDLTNADRNVYYEVLEYCKEYQVKTTLIDQVMSISSTLPKIDDKSLMICLKKCDDFNLSKTRAVVMKRINDSPRISYADTDYDDLCWESKVSIYANAMFKYVNNWNQAPGPLKTLTQKFIKM